MSKTLCKKIYDPGDPGTVETAAVKDHGPSMAHAMAQVSTIDAATLPLGILADAKPKLLLPPEQSEPIGPPLEAPTPTV